MRTIGVVTVGRSDFGIYLPVIRAIEAHSSLQLHLIVSGSHLSPEFGMTVREIEAQGIAIGDRVEMLVSSDSALGTGTSLGLGVMGFAQALTRTRPDILLVLGDRFEMFSAALAALPLGIPVAHIHGGEVTMGAIDDALRHAMTKLSHLHFVSTEEYGRRVSQLGEEPWRITVSGAPALDRLRTETFLTRDELTARFNVPLDTPPLLVTFHPTTLEADDQERQTDELLAALSSTSHPIVFTQPNADAGGRNIAERFDAFQRQRASVYRVSNLGVVGYVSMMKHSAAMIGNSSSGLIEAPSVGLPVVNIGNRQAGRVRAANVIDVENERAEIAAAIARAASTAFRAEIAGLVNPYGDGTASTAIAERLASAPLDASLRLKRFNDWSAH